MTNTFQYRLRYYSNLPGSKDPTIRINRIRFLRTFVLGMALRNMGLNRKITSQNTNNGGRTAISNSLVRVTTLNGRVKKFLHIQYKGADRVSRFYV